MPRVLIVAATTGYQVRVFADAARRIGANLALATDCCHMLEDPWGDSAIPVRFQHPAASARRIDVAGPFDGIVAVGDRPAMVAAEAAAALGLRYHPPAAARACHDKFLARQLYAAAGLPVPRFFRVRVDEQPQAAARRAPYPCVLKPLGLSASRGVIRADNECEFVAAFGRILRILHSPDVRVTREEVNHFIQVESYIPGGEFALEGLVTDGKLQALALFDKPDPLEGPYFEETIYVTPSRAAAAIQEAILEAAQRAVTAVGMTHGPLHAEMRVNQQGVWMLELAARPIGGLCAHALIFEGEVPLEELILRHALGEDVSRARLSAAASGVMMMPIPKAGIYEGISGVAEAQETAEVIVTAKEGQSLAPLPEGSSYLGFLFARGASPDDVEAALRQAYSRLQFHIATALPTLKPSI